MRDPLLEMMQGDPEYYSFGAEIAERAEYSLIQGKRDLPFEAKNSAMDLRTKVRALLGSSKETDKEAVEHTTYLFNTKDMNLFKADAGLSTDPGRDILLWIAEAQGKDGLRDIAILALWNRTRRDQLQQRLVEDRRLMKTGMLQSTEKLEGTILPAGSTELYEKAYDASTIKAMDSFEAGLMVAGGYHDDGIIAFPNFYLASDGMHGHTEQSEGVIIHEGTHATGWHNRGFMHGVASPLARRIWEEFFASHVEAVTTAKPGREEPYLIDPNLRRDIWRSYHTEAEYISYVDALADNGIPIDLIGHAYISKFDEHDPPRARWQLEQKIIQVSGSIAAWNTLTNAYETSDLQQEREQILGEEMQRLESISGVSAPRKRSGSELVRSLADAVNDGFTEYELMDESPVDLVIEFADNEVEV